MGTSRQLRMAPQTVRPRTGSPAPTKPVKAIDENERLKSQNSIETATADKGVKNEMINVPVHRPLVSQRKSVWKALVIICALAALLAVFMVMPFTLSFFHDLSLADAKMQVLQWVRDEHAKTKAFGATMMACFLVL